MDSLQRKVMSELRKSQSRKEKERCLINLSQQVETVENNHILSLIICTGYDLENTIHIGYPAHRAL